MHLAIRLNKEKILRESQGTKILRDWAKKKTKSNIGTEQKESTVTKQGQPVFKFN